MATACLDSLGWKEKAKAWATYLFPSELPAPSAEGDVRKQQRFPAMVRRQDGFSAPDHELTLRSLWVGLSALPIQSKRDIEANFRFVLPRGPLKPDCSRKYFAVAPKYLAIH